MRFTISGLKLHDVAAKTQLEDRQAVLKRGQIVLAQGTVMVKVGVQAIFEFDGG